MIKFIANIINGWLDYKNKTVRKIVLWFKKSELRRAVNAANKINRSTGRTVLIVNTNGGLQAICKSDFKRMWASNPKFKKVTLHRWYSLSDNWYQVCEDLKPENKFIHSN